MSFVICNLPSIAKMAAISQAGKCSGFLQGTSAETSGGLLICLPREQAPHFCSEIKSSKYGEGRQAQIVSIVEKGNQTAGSLTSLALLRSCLVGPLVLLLLLRTPVPPLSLACEMEQQKLYTSMDHSLQLILGRNFQRRLPG